MSYTTCYNQSCPAPVSVVVNQTFLMLGATAAIVDTYTVTVTGTQVTLPYTPLGGYPIVVLVNGLRQAVDTHYTISGTNGTIITFLAALDGDDVQVDYAHLAT